MKRIVLTMMMTALVVMAYSQSYKGVVQDAAGHPIHAVAVVANKEGGGVAEFVKTDQEGNFEISLKDIPASFTFLCVGYETVTIPVNELGENPVLLKEKRYELKEVKVKSNRIIQRSDTLTFSVAGFQQKQDRTIADVIKKMPGMDVAKDGTISYQGKPINKFYIEGNDLLGGKYAQASENIEASKVKNVQVYENHQPVKALKDVSFSEQAALNIQLKDDEKNIWQGLADFKTGSTLQGSTEWLRDIRVMEMVFGRKKQSISMVKTNNCGRDIKHEVMNLSLEEMMLQPETGILNPISLAAPDLEEERYRFNDSHLFATNWLVKTKKDHDLRIQGEFFWNRDRQNQYSETRYTDIDNGQTIIEDNRNHTIHSEWNGEVLYKINTNQLYVNNLFKGYVDFDKSYGMTTLNENHIRQQVKPRERDFSDFLEIIKSNKGNKAWSVKTAAMYSFLPGTLLLSDERMEKLDMGTFKWNTATSFRHKVGGVNITYQAGTNILSQKLELELPEDNTKNDFQMYRVFISPSLSYKKNAVRINGSAQLSYLYRNFEGIHKNEMMIEPTGFLLYEPNSYISLSMSYSYHITPNDIKTISDMPIYTDYISMRTGTGKMESVKSHSGSVGARYHDIMRGLFANAGVTYGNSRDRVLYSSTMTGEIYQRQATDLHDHGDSWTITGNISKAFGWAKMKINATNRCSWNNYHLLMGEQLVPYQMRSMTSSIGFSLKPNKFMAIEEESEWMYSKQINKEENFLSGDALNAFTHQLKIFLLPGNWQVEWKNEWYHSNDESVSFNYFADLNVSYRTKTYEIGMFARNIIGNKTYERKYTSTYQQMYSITRLRPREVMAKVMFNF